MKKAQIQMQKQESRRRKGKKDWGRKKKKDSSRKSKNDWGCQTGKKIV